MAGDSSGWLVAGELAGRDGTLEARKKARRKLRYRRKTASQTNNARTTRTNVDDTEDKPGETSLEITGYGK